MSIPARRRHAAALSLVLAAAAPGAAHAAVADAPRGYELVSPPGAGARSVSALPPTGPWSAPIAADGQVLFRVSPALPGSLDETTDTLLRAERTAAGWQRTPLAVPQAVMKHDGVRVAAASPDLGSVIMQPTGNDRASGESLASGATDPGSDYAYNFLARAGSLTWLSANGLAHDYAGDQKVADTVNAGSIGLFAADDGTTVFVSRASLDPEVPTGLGAVQLYRRAGASITAAARRPDGSLATTGVAVLGASADVRTVLYEEASAPQPDSSVASDLVVAGPTGAKQANRPRLTTPVARTASQVRWASITPDGATVLFTTLEPLVDGDTDVSVDLYRYTPATDTLALLSRGHGGAPGGNDDDCSAVLYFSTCDATPALVSRDGQTAYFFAPEQLDGTAGAPSTLGLYLSEGDDAPQLVATLSTPDLWTVAIGDQWQSRAAYEVTAAGDLVFESASQVGAGQTGGLTQVWRYDRSSHALACLTCRPSGATPNGPSMLSPDPAEGSRRGTAPFVQVPNGGGSRRVTADGATVFVTSYDRLSEDDENAAADVYAIDVASGSQHLVTTGRGSRDSYLVGTDADGSDVFFLTVDSLDPSDDNGPGGKLYDARIGGGFAPPPAPDPCRGAACRVLAEAPVEPTNASQTAFPDTSAPADDLEPELVTPTAASRARIATTGRLAVKVTGLQPGSVAALRVRVWITARTSVSATVTSRGGGADRTLTARFSRSQRLRILAARKKRTLPVQLRLDHGSGDPAVLSTSIARVRKGR